MRGTHPQARTGKPGWDARSDKRIERQKVCLEALGNGATVKRACELAGVGTTAYTNWRKDDPHFKAECDVARSKARGLKDGLQENYSFLDFRKQYFGMETYVHQAQIVDALESIEPREIVLVNIWPEAGKTTTLEDWICQQLAFNPNLRITDLSQSRDLCMKTIDRIKQRMTDELNFGRFIGAFGPFHQEGARGGKPWTTEHFTVEKADHDERDYSMQARAISSSTYGTRMDILLIDDIQARENLNQTESILATLRHTYFSRGVNIKILIIGTRIGPGDVYERLIEEEIIDRYIAIPAMQPDGTPTCREMWGVPKGGWEKLKAFAGCATWEEAVDTQIAKIRKQAGETAWWSSYMQQPHISGLATFTDEMVEDSKDKDRNVGPPAFGDFVALSLDPALGGGNALTAAVHGVDRLTVLDQLISYNFARVEDILGGIESFAQRYHPVVVVIERDAFQKGLVNDERLRQLSHTYGFQIVPHTTSKNKADPILGCASMASGFMLGEIRLPYGDDFARTRMDPLIGQLRAWRPDVSGRLLKQDGVMSLWFNWRYWMENRVARGDSDMHSAWNRGGTPYDPTPYAAISYS